MKITHNKVGQNLNLRESGHSDKKNSIFGKEDKTEVGKASSSDLSPLENLGSPSLKQSNKEMDSAAILNLSSRAQDIKKATELAKAAPDINEEKVSRLQKLIDEGKYVVDSKAVANKMVDEELGFSDY